MVPEIIFNELIQHNRHSPTELKTIMESVSQKIDLFFYHTESADERFAIITEFSDDGERLSASLVACIFDTPQFAQWFKLQNATFENIDINIALTDLLAAICDENQRAKYHLEYQHYFSKRQKSRNREQKVLEGH